MEGHPVFDVLVIGAGPAGLMAASTCARRGLRVLLLDGKEKIGAKILISGGGRCNLTNLKASEKDYGTDHPAVVRSVLRNFSCECAIRYFKNLGVELTPEEDGKLFPVTQSARTVLDALTKELTQSGARLECARKVTALGWDQALFQADTRDGFCFLSKTVVLATGGLSYPGTGSDGTGYLLAQALGHTIIKTTPALTPLITNDAGWKSLTGITLPSCLTLRCDGKEIISFQGPLLFTHFGFSGPVVLNLSRYWLRHRHLSGISVTANFLPALPEIKLRETLASGAQETPKRLLKNFLTVFFPQRFIEVFLEKSGMDGQVSLGQFKKVDREKLIRALRALPLNISDGAGYEKAEATAGGVDLEEVCSKTLGSKLRPGLFFAGEVLDADGRIGGFNFQWAWASAVTAALGVVKFLKSSSGDL